MSEVVAYYFNEIGGMKKIEEAPVYVLLQREGTYTVDRTVEVSEHCNVDLDKDGYPIGIEIMY